MKVNLFFIYFILFYFFIRYESQSWQRKKNISVDIYIFYPLIIIIIYYVLLEDYRLQDELGI